VGYVAVKGGREAVEASIALLEKYRTDGDCDVELGAIERRMSLLVDRVMSEAGFYAPRYAALALKQSQGAAEEAVFLLRAYRSTLSRAYRSLPLDGVGMTIRRRISAAFKDIPGGQFLGATCDYTHRLLDFDLANETPLEIASIREKWKVFQASAEPGDPITAERVSDGLKDEGLIAIAADDEEPSDITQHPITFPAPRSSRLQTLARADTGFISALAYAGIRGFGLAHPTVGELRAGSLEVLIRHPLLEGETLCAGEILVTEVESIFPEETDETKRQEEDDPLLALSAGQGDKADASDRSLGLGTGYGMVLGRNDNKAIAMSILDYFLESGEGILGNQEFVLLHGDCLEMNGFLSHLKLPHYVTFQSKLDRVRNAGKRCGNEGL
jgi:alpha-D-ribose 1-methylphosphonate 5-triphosphate synthase subunit PhnI